MHPRQYSMVWMAWYTTVSAKSNCKETQKMKEAARCAGRKGWLTGENESYLVLSPRTSCLNLDTDTVFSWFSMSVLWIKSKFSCLTGFCRVTVHCCSFNDCFHVLLYKIKIFRILPLTLPGKDCTATRWCSYEFTGKLHVLLQEKRQYSKSVLCMHLCEKTVLQNMDLTSLKAKIKTAQSSFEKVLPVQFITLCASVIFWNNNLKKS